MPPRLDRKITLLRRTQATDGAGAPVETWQDVGDMWAGLVQIRGGESVSNAATRADMGVILRIRFLRCLDSISAPGEYRARYNGSVYDVSAVVEDTKQPRRSYQVVTMAHIQGTPTLASVPTV